MGIGDGPFSSMGEGIFSEHFADIEVAAHQWMDYDVATGWDRYIVEFKIPAMNEDGTPLVEDDEIFFSIQVNDISKVGTFNPSNSHAMSNGHMYTRGAQTHFYNEITDDLGAYCGAVLSATAAK